MIQTFREFVEAKDLYNFDLKHILPAIGSGDHMALMAYTDNLEERGKEVPEFLRRLLHDNAFFARYAEYLPDVIRYYENPSNFKIFIRWLIRRDAPEVLMIDPEMTEQQLNSTSRQREMVGNVAETDTGVLVGYSIHRQTEDYYELLRLIVHPMLRRTGIGRKIIDKLKTRMVNAPQNQITANNIPPESAEFFKSQKFTGNNNNYTWRKE